MFHSNQIKALYLLWTTYKTVDKPHHYQAQNHLLSNSNFIPNLSHILYDSWCRL